MMKDKKYELVKEKAITRYGRTVYPIRALKSFADVEKGEIGGYIESESNLSHEGDCWVYDNAVVCENAEVKNDAVVKNNALVRGHAVVRDSSYVKENACVKDHAILYDNVVLRLNSCVQDYATLAGSVLIHGEACIAGEATVSDNVMVTDNARVDGRALLDGWFTVKGDAHIGCWGCINCYYDYYLCEIKEIKETPITFYKTYAGEIDVCVEGYCGSIKGFLNYMRKNYGNRICGKSIIAFLKAYYHIFVKKG